MKVAIITDQHFGARNDSPQFLDFYEKFYRDTFFPKLEENNIKSYSSHRPVYFNDAFSEFAGASRFKSTSETYFNRILHIPCRYDLSDDQVNMIADTVKKALIK